MSRLAKSFFALLFFGSSLLPAPVPVTAQPKATDFSELEKVILSELKETKTPGAAVAVIRSGRLDFAKGFGLASVETNIPITPDTLFRLGSTTKLFTGAAVVALAEQGQLKLAAPIGDYARGLTSKLARVTAHQLLSNSAGLGDFAAPFISQDDAALARMVRAWKDDVFFAEPGQLYSYASPGFWLAGYVIEEVAGKPYADAMDELLFKPLGMRRTTLRPLLALTWPLALGHNLQNGEKAEVIRPAFNNVAMWPAGSIFSNANELARFVLAFLARGRLVGKQVFPPSLFATLAGKHSVIPGEPDTFYGYGLLNFDYRGVRLLMHGGFSRGYGSMIQMAPEHGFAIIVLTNKSGETLNKTTEKAKELFLPLKPTVAETPKRVLPLTAADVAACRGKYVNGPQTWEIIAKEGRLFLREEATERELKKTASQRLSWGSTLENDVILLAGTDGKIEYIFTGLYSARRIMESR